MATRKKKERWPKHQMGKYYGYDIFEDGSIRVASAHSEVLRKIVLEEQAIDALLMAVTRQCHELLQPLVERRRNFWNHLMDDYGLELGDRWTLDYISRMLRKKDPNE